MNVSDVAGLILGEDFEMKVRGTTISKDAVRGRILQYELHETLDIINRMNCDTLEKVIGQIPIVKPLNPLPTDLAMARALDMEERRKELEQAMTLQKKFPDTRTQLRDLLLVRDQIREGACSLASGMEPKGTLLEQSTKVGEQFIQDTSPSSDSLAITLDCSTEEAVRQMMKTIDGGAHIQQLYPTKYHERRFNKPKFHIPMHDGRPDSKDYMRVHKRHLKDPTKTPESKVWQVLSRYLIYNEGWITRKILTEILQKKDAAINDFVQTLRVPVDKI